MTDGATIPGRRERMGLLARARPAELAERARSVALPTFEWLRAPETGLVMVRGRAGGSGAPFNLGEMTVTRCTVTLSGGAIGHACVAGRSHEHARLAALVDAACEVPALAPSMARDVLAPLARAETERRRRTSADAAETTVEFFTLERGDSP